MTVQLESPTLARSGRPSPHSVRLIRAEIMKIRTTNTWWLFLIGMVAVTALAFLFNGVGHHYELYPPSANGARAAELQAQAAQSGTPAELIELYGMGSRHIAEAVKRALRRKARK